MQRFRDFFASKLPLSQEEWSIIKEKVTVKTFEKGDVIHHMGDVFTELMFIDTGVVRSYFIDRNGRDFTWQIHFYHPDADLKNLFVVDFASLTRQAPSMMTFEAIAACELYAISYEDREALLSIDKKWEHFGRKLAEDVYSIVYYRTASLLTLSAEERYKQLLEESPGLFEMVPQHYIASYLGITPQSLSRLKADITIG